MAWKVEFDPTAERDLNRLDPQHARKILTFLSERIAKDEDPRRFGAPLRSNFAGLWKYRVEDYRLICDIQEEKVLVLVLHLGHRSKVYGGCQSRTIRSCTPHILLDHLAVDHGASALTIPHGATAPVNVPPPGSVSFSFLTWDTICPRWSGMLCAWRGKFPV
ncbi:MAG: type II toxin-antitoxin system RelE family toxin [Desulfurivibrionaceae bacterium]